MTLFGLKIYMVEINSLDLTSLNYCKLFFLSSIIIFLAPDNKIHPVILILPSKYCISTKCIKINKESEIIQALSIIVYLLNSALLKNSFL